MTKLAVLEEMQVFPPRRYLLIVWCGTFLFAIFGVIATPGWTMAIYLWSMIGIVALWQLWTLRWAELDVHGISNRNIFRQRRTLHWAEITSFKEQEVQLNKRSYAIIRLSNVGSAARVIRITITSDQVDFDRLREIIRATVPTSADR